jgi:hypothetical protein
MCWVGAAAALEAVVTCLEQPQALRSARQLSATMDSWINGLDIEEVRSPRAR